MKDNIRSFSAILIALVLCLFYFIGQSQDNDKSKVRATIVRPVTFPTNDLLPVCGQVSDTIKGKNHIFVLHLN